MSDSGIAENAMVILKQETPEEMFRRVARNVASADALYDEDADLAAREEEFFGIISRLEFLPNSPTLMNAGAELQQLSACFVLPVGDSMESIFNAVKNTALIHKSGGGTGFSFSSLRPKGDVVGGTSGLASGPVSFMTVFDAATEAVKQGGMRRGANMGVLSVNHPDIIEFITAKRDTSRLTNFNLSVAVTDEFMRQIDACEEYDLINPRTSEAVERISAKEVFDLIVESAWLSGEPGIVFIDRMNEFNPTPHLHPIESTNPCGEQPLIPYESCDLGSIALPTTLKKENGGRRIDWEKLRSIVRTGVRFLDNAIDVNRFPMEEIEQITKSNRKIGLGVMGFADLLILLGIRYDTKEAEELGTKIMSFIQSEARKTSEEMADARGAFPNFEGSIFDKPGAKPLRNATLTTIAPTGTISIIANCSSGIEPLYSIAYFRRTLESEKLVVTNPYFEEIAEERGFYREDLMSEIAERSTIQNMDEIPEDVRRLFATAHDISPEWHIRIMAAFQKHTDNAVSKTVNFPREASQEDIREGFLLAHRLGCKGVTVYREGSRPGQILSHEM
jgi:ribonucleoside-diphosphate reductase alpha chain